MTKLEDIAVINVLASVVPSTITATGNGSACDFLHDDGACFAIQSIGSASGTTPSLTGKIQESSDNSTWTDVTGATFTAVTAANNLQKITFLRTKRYLRHSYTVSGTSPVMITCVLLGQQKKVA
jgi:hypothetical protein